MCFARGRVGGHDNGWGGGEWCRWEVGVVHEGDVWLVVCAGCKMKLVSLLLDVIVIVRVKAYKTSVLEDLDDL